MPSKIEKSYLAGVIDSDGCLLVTKPKRGGFIARLDICQSNIEDLKKIQKIWGGQLNFHKRSNHLVWQGKNALLIVQEIYPYFKFKNEQVTLFMYFLDTLTFGIGKRLTEEMKIGRQIIYERLRSLKREKYA